MSLSNQVLVESLIQSLEKYSQTFGVAESCTCGMLAASLAYRSGVSKTFMGGVVSYANEAKEVLLGVSSESLKTHGAVSKEVALEMAKGVRAKLQTDWSVSVTGIAGPTGGSAEKPVGTVWLAVVGPNLEESRKQIFSGDRRAVQQATVDYALRFLLENINKFIKE